MSTTPMNSPQHGQERTANFFNRYPLSKTLKIQPITWGDQGANGGVHNAFDIDDVKGLLGPTRFANLMKTVKTEFVYYHRAYPAGHPQAGFHVHSISADDLESFLRGGN